MELRKGLKVMKRKTVISLIIATILMVSLITAIVFTQSEKMMLLKEAKQELKRAMNYDEFEEGEENIEGTDNVKFSAFFLRDLNADGYAEKIKGTCKPIGSEDTLYMELNVLTAGYLKDAKVEINGKNFYLQTALPKDNELKNNYIGNNVKIIEFNNIVNGTQKLFSGIVRSGDYSYSTGKTAAIGNNIANYSREDNIITFSGTYVAEDGTETRIVKIIPIIMDWYGTTNAMIGSTMQNNYDLDNRIDEENNSLVLDFTVNVSETQNKLILSKNYVEGEIPELNGFAPTYVGLENSQGLTFNYDEETRKFTIEKLATLNENLVTKTVARSSSYKFQVVYPYEAYEDNFGDTITLKIPVRTYFEGYNNPNTEFENPYVSNTAKGTITVKFEHEREVEEIKNSRVGVTVGKSVTSPTKRNIVSKLKPLNIYNGVSETEDNDTYEVRWNAYIGEKDAGKKLVFMESKEDSVVQESDVFIKNDASKISMEAFVSNVGIYLIHDEETFNEDGYVKIYDVENDSLIFTFDKNNWNVYSSNEPYYYEFPIKHIRVETSEMNVDSSLEIVNIKQINDEILTNTYTREEFSSLQNIESTMEVYVDQKDIGTKKGTANYEAPYSIATLSLNKNNLSTQVITKNERFVIDASYNSVNNQAYWKDASYLIKFPEEVLNVNINDIYTNNDNVNIITYEVIDNDDGLFIKINTENNAEDTSYQIVIDTDLTPNPRKASSNKDIELYASNRNLTDYYWQGEDLYDVDNDLNTNEIINLYKTKLNLVAPNSLLTDQTISEYNQDNTVLISPQIAELVPYYEGDRLKKQIAKITVRVSNNYEYTISDVKIIGKIPFSGNTTVLTGEDLQSEFDTIMVSEGIHIPDNLKNKVDVYYSENDNVTKDIDLLENGWKKYNDITEWSKVKTFLIDFKDEKMNINDIYDFSYYIEVPESTEYNKISYSQHGIYFSLDTSEGKYQTQTEPNKLGLTKVKKYDLNLTKYQKGKQNIVPGATYKIVDVENGKMQTAVTSENGILVFEDLYIERNYEIQEIKVPDNYEINNDIISVTGNVNEEGLLELDLNDSNVRNYRTNEDKNNLIGEIEVEDEIKAKLKLIVKEKDNEVFINNVAYKITGYGLPENGRIVKTNLSGEINVSNIRIGEEYYLEPVKNDGYYPTSPIRFNITNENGIYVVNIIDGEVLTSDILEDNNIPIANIIVEIEKIERYTLDITKIKRILDVDIRESEEVEQEFALSGAKFKLYKNTEEIGTFISDENGKIVIENLYQYKEGKDESGEYILKEVLPPNGYTRTKDIVFKVNSTDGLLKFECLNRDDIKAIVEGTVVKLVLEDSPIIKLIKKDEETGERLKDIKFAIYNIDSEELPAKQSNGELLGTKEIIDDIEYYIVKTDDNGEILLDLPEGLYKAVEVEAPEKYDLSNNEFYFGVGESREGVKSYKKIIGRDVNSSVVDAIKTSDGGYMVSARVGVGSTSINFSDDVVLTNPGSYMSGAVAKYDSNLNVEWYKFINGTAYTITETSDGGYVLGGYHDRTMNFGNNISLAARGNDPEGFIVKYNSNFEAQWAKKLSGDDEEYVETIVEMSDGTLLVGGCFNSTQIEFVGNEEFNLSNISDKYTSWGSRVFYIDSFIARYDSSGNVISSKLLGGNVRDDIQSMIETDDGGYMVAGNFTSANLSLDNDIVLATNGDYDILILKYNKNDELEWYKQIGGSGEDKVERIVKTNQGGYLLSASIKTAGLNFAEGVAVEREGNVLVKYSKNMNVEWLSTFDVNITQTIYDGNYMCTSGDLFYEIELIDQPKLNIDNLKLYANPVKVNASYYSLCDVKEVEDGYLIASSRANIPLSDTISVYSGIAKFDKNLNPMWANKYSGGDLDRICVLNNGNLIMGGSYHSRTAISNTNGSLISTSAYHYDIILDICDSTGKLLRSKRIGNSSYQSLGGMIGTNDGGYIIVGESEGNVYLESGKIMENTSRYDGAFIIAYDKNDRVKWYKTFNGTADSVFSSVEKMNDGTYLVSGTLGSKISYDGLEFASGSIKLKINENGEIIWGISQSGTLKEENNGFSIYTGAKRIKYSNDGERILEEEYIGIPRITLKDGGVLANVGSILYRYDANGDLKWEKNIYESPRLIKEIGDDRYFVITIYDYKYTFEDGTIVSATGREGYSLYEFSVNQHVPEMQEIVIENERKEFNITTEVELKSGIANGTISGSGLKSYEKVKYGDDSVKEIKIVPNEGYEIGEILINNESQRFNSENDGSYILSNFKDVKEDKHIKVRFIVKENKFLINKVDNETKEKIPNVEFNIKGIEEREELIDEIGNLVDNGINYYELDKNQVYNESLGELVDNGLVYDGVPNETIEVEGCTGELTNNGTYYFTNSNGTLIPSNKGINNSVAQSYMKIDLSGLTGTYVVKINASVSSESNYDFGFARITDSTTALAYNNTTGRFMYISGNVTNSNYTSQILTGGKIYYLHLGYRKDGSVNNNNDQVVINSIKIHPLEDGNQYNFENDENKLISSNQNVPNTIVNSYIPIDLTDKVGGYAVVVNAEISSQLNGDIGYATITESIVRPEYNDGNGRFIYISGEVEDTEYQSQWLEGGKVYYLHLGYYKNATIDSGTDTFTINDIALYGTTVMNYEFINEYGKIISNNQTIQNTVANSYIPIDMTDLIGEYNVVVNAEISSQLNNDYGYVTVTDSPERVEYNNANGRFVYLSGNTEAKEYYSEKIEGGKVYYLHLGYYKNATIDSGTDTFTINSVKVVPNTEHLYDVNVITNRFGEAITEIPYGKYVVTEINTPEGYEPLDSSVIIEFRENGEKEFTIENKKLAKVIVHHYKAEADISKSGYIYTEEKLVEDEVYMDRTGYPYSTSPKLDLGEYSLITDALGEYILPENATGQYNGVIEVSYYYSASKIPLRVQHIIEGTEDRVELATGEKSEDEISYGKQGESYETIPIPKDVLHEKYEVVDSSGNTSGTYEYTEEDIVVNYYYKIKEFDVTTGVKMKTQTDILGNESVVAGGTILGANEDVYETVLYGEDSTKDIVATPDEGYYVEILTVNDEPVTFTPDENGIVRLANFSNMREDKMVMVGFAQDKGKVTVHHKLQDVDEYVPSIEDGKTVEPEIKEGDIGKPFATKPSDKVALRYEAKSNTEPSSGVYTLEDQEVTYYYGYKDFEYKIEYYYNGVLDETKTENGIATWGTVIDSYTDKVEYGYELGEVENYPLTVSEYVENNIIKVNYEPKDTSLIVKYVDKHTGEEIAERKTVPGKMFEKHDLTEDIIDIEGYTFLEIPEPIIVDTSLEVQEYIIYYAANTKVTINYLDKADGKILETIIIEGKVDDPYEAYAKDFDKYVLDTKPENESGLMTREEIVLDYYYIYVSDGVIEKHIDLRTDRLLDSSYYTGMEGDPYTTDKKEFVGYDILTNKQYYKEFIKEQFTEDEILNILKEYNLETEEELFEKHTEDLILKVLKEKGLNAEDEYIPENKDGFMEKGVIEVKYYYVRKTKVIVEYIDKQTGKPVQVETKVDLDGDGVIDEVRVSDAIEIIEGHEGDRYETIAKEFDGYILQKDEEGKDIIPENANGEMTKEDIFVRYEYIKRAKVLEKHIDVKTGILIENVTVHEGYVGKEYDIKSKEFEKYHLVEDKLPTNSKGTMIDGDIVVEYYYIHEGKVIIEYLDKYSGEKLQEKVEKDLNEDLVIEESEFELVDSTIIIEGLEGDEYTSSAKEFEKYKLIESELPSNGSGTMTKEDITVKYYYVKESVGIREEHRDSSTNELLEEPIIHPGYEGDSYKIDSKEFNNYDLDSDKLPSNSEGKMSKEEIVVTYYYKRKTEVIVKYVNEETGEELLEEVVIRGHVGDNYIAEEKVIDGYTLVKITSNREGTMDKNVIVVTYYYVKAPEVIHKPDEPVVPEVPEVQEQPKEEADHVVIGNTVTVNNQVVNTATNTAITANTITNTTNTIISNTVKNEDYNKDKEVETPKTGDNTPIVLVIGCMFVLMLNTIHVLASTNKKQKPKNIIIVGKDKKKQK